MRAVDMASAEKDARRPIDLIPILDGWIEVAEDVVACRWAAVSRQSIDILALGAPHPLLDLLSLLQLMRQYRDQVLREAGYASFGCPPPSLHNTITEQQQG